MANKWLIFTRGTVPLYRLDMFDQLLKFSKKFYGNDFSRLLYINEGNKLWWGLDENEVNILGKKLIKTLSDKNKSKKHISNYREYLKEAIKFSEKAIKADLTKLSKIRLIKLSKKLDEETAKAGTLANIDLDIFDIVFEDFFEDKIKELIGIKCNQNEPEKIIRKLSIPVVFSFIAKEQIELMNLSLNKKLSEKDIKEISEKYWWTNLGWENIKTRTLDDWKELIKEYQKDDKLQEKIKEFKKRNKRILLERKMIIKKYKIKKEINYWLKILDEYTLFHDWRKEYQIKWLSASREIMLETGRRLGLSADDLDWLRHKELCGLLEGKPFNEAEIKRRKEAVCLKISEGKISIWSGNNAILQHKKEIKEKEEILNEFKGKSANGGIVTARVKVCNGAAEALRKIEKGDILVTGMTVPDHVPAMKKATAIITNEGGITCHAAIVSRELGIPCIVGTKIATKVLKDGDLVEVDAERGIVKILERKNKK